MSDFSRDLKKRVEQALGHGPAWGEVNPLVVIGLTEAMLDLGLTEDQMYKAVRSYVRQLASQVHPDRPTANVSENRRQQIFRAFEVLDDRNQFSKALAEFRSLKSEDRKELRLLHEALANVKDKLFKLQEREAEFTHGLAQLERDRLIFERAKAPMNARAAQLKSDLQELRAEVKNIPRLRSGISELNVKVGSLEKRLRASVKKHKALRRHLSARKLDQVEKS